MAFFSLLSFGIINNLLINLEKLRLEAFRSNNIINQYIFQEIKKSYKNFITKWIENPSSIDKLKKKIVSSFRKFIR